MSQKTTEFSAPRTGTVAAQDLRQYSVKEVIQVMTALLAGLFTAMISTTVVSTALPTLMADLDGTQQQYTWVITSSLLAMTISTPIWGKLSDLFNKKVLTQLSIVLFVAGSIVAGLAIDVTTMMVARAVQGIAMGGLMALTQAIMGMIITPRDRGKYAGFMGAVMAVATVSGPFLGGLITDSLGWRWCFFVSVPLAVVALILLQLKLTLPNIAREKARIDYFGGVLVAFGAALPMLWVTFAGHDFDWISWESGLYGAAFLVVAVLFVIVELRVKDPMVPLRVLGNQTAIFMIVTSVGAGVAMFGSSVFLTQYFQMGAGYTPTEAGVMTIPLIVAQLVSSTVGGLIVSRTGRWKLLMLFGSLLLLVGVAGLGTIDHNTQYFTVAVFMVLMGIGVGTLVQNIVLAVQNVVDVTDIGAASAAIAFFRSLAGAVGVAVLGALLTIFVGDNISGRLSELGVKGNPLGSGSDTKLDLEGLPGPIKQVFHESYADAFGPLFLIAAVISVTAVIAILLVKETPLRTTISLNPSRPESKVDAVQSVVAVASGPVAAVADQDGAGAGAGAEVEVEAGGYGAAGAAGAEVEVGVGARAGVGAGADSDASSETSLTDPKS